MAEKSIIIIGAGIAGLATGCYGQMNGYRTRIFELHDKPGGLCTAWTRKGYTIDGCIHWLIGAGPNSRFYPIWEELGAVQGRRMIYHEEFVRFEGSDGRTFVVYTDIDRLAQHMKALSPADAELIETYARALRRFTGCELFAMPILKPRELLSMALPMAGSLAKWGTTSMEDFGARFSDPFLRRVFPLIHDYPPLPMAAHLTNLSSMVNRSAGWPVGGSLAFSQAIERRYLALGGEVHYRARVDKVLVQDNRAVGVRLADGSEHRADVIISAADGHTTIFDMLGGKYINDRIRGYYADPSDAGGYAVQVSLGVARDLSDEPHAITLLLDQPVNLAGETQDRLTVEHMSFDPSMAPENKSVMRVYLESGYDYWKPLYDDRARYRAEKQAVVDGVIEQLERHFPGLKAQVEVVDVATPMTFERFTSNWHGSQAWLPEKGFMGVMLKGLSKTLPGLEDFYMVGQWAQAMGGLPTVAAGGRKLIEALCRREGRVFTVTKA